MMILPPVCMHAFATRAYTGVEMIMEYTGDSCTKKREADKREVPSLAAGKHGLTIDQPSLLSKHTRPPRATLRLAPKHYGPAA